MAFTLLQSLSRLPGLFATVAQLAQAVRELSSRVAVMEAHMSTLAEQLTQEVGAINQELTVLPQLLTEAQSAAQLAGQTHDDLAALKAQIAQLQSQAPGVDLSGLQTQVTALQNNVAPLANLKPQLDSVVNALAAAPPPAPAS